METPDFDDQARELADGYADEIDPSTLAELVLRRRDWRLRRGFRVCSTCRLRKPVSAFGRDGSRRDGLEPRCRSCRRANANS